MSSLYRGSRDRDRDDAVEDEDGELAPGRRTLTSRLGGTAMPGGIRQNDDLPPVPEAEQAHWRDKFGLEFDDTGHVRDEAPSGAPLPPSLRNRFSSGLGADLSDVRVHTDRAAGAAAGAVSARAFAVGQDIFFGQGAYDPESHDGQHLIAHEVAHTVQQRGSVPAPQYKLAVSQPGDALEAEADRAADALASGRTAPPLSRGDTRIARDTGGAQPPAPTTFPIPVTLVPLGDRFDFTFVSPTPDKLQVTATYKGPPQPRSTRSR